MRKLLQACRICVNLNGECSSAHQSQLLKAIIDRHNGIIDFDSCPDEGSTFYFDGLNSLAAPATSRCGFEEDFIRRQTARYQSGFVLIHYRGFQKFSVGLAEPVFPCIGAEEFPFLI